MVQDGEREGPVRPASLGNALKRGLGDLYDRLGMSMAGSFIWFLSTSAPIAAGLELARRNVFASVPLSAAAAFLLGMPITAGCYEMARRIVTRDDPSLGDLKKGFCELYWPSLKLTLFDLIITGVLLADAAFFLGRMGPLKYVNTGLTLAVGTLFIYALLAWLMSALYHMPLLVWQRTGTLVILKRGFLLAMDNPGFTMGLLFGMMLLTILCVLTAVGMAVLFLGAAAILTTNCLRELFIKYGIIEEPPEVVEDRGWPRSGEG